jgi:hypothetical protein
MPPVPPSECVEVPIEECKKQNAGDITFYWKQDMLVLSFQEKLLIKMMSAPHTVDT